ncbi:MAG: hypothetical protein OEV40_08380 [Acidimicrobiia bacterium]|nr:hypothetical protein [Acidimicrobiia bacterium]
MRSLLSRPLGLFLVLLLVAAGCASAASDQARTTDDPDRVYFATIPTGGELPDGATCAELVLDDDVPAGAVEVRPENTKANATTVEVDGGIVIDGADERWNDALAPRIRGDFTGTTDQILRWGACKWGLDEDLTRARAVTESSWMMATEGDETDDREACALLGRLAPCAQSFGLLQVKGTVHEGTYPASVRSTAFGVDYALAWLRACFEGSFTWLDDQGYEAGDELGCVGAWFSGNWWDQPANDYVGEVRYHLEARTWESYRA